MNSRIKLLLIFVSALLVSYIPVIHLPFTWIQTFFHEISHGLTAILSGGKIQSVVLRTDGSGLCVTRGGVLFMISFAGYFGATVWGVLLYLTSNNYNYKISNALSILLILLILTSTVMWAKDFTTIIILLTISLLLALFIKFRQFLSVAVVIQFIGVYTLMDAVTSPLVLLGVQQKGDAASLAELTHLPAFIWVIVWEICAILAIYFLWKTLKGKQFSASA